tara:strand:+ start:945 stop:1166 length:222 start_codon:yes stop_codon:yes gene_type:complete
MKSLTWLLHDAMSISASRQQITTCIAGAIDWIAQVTPTQHPIPTCQVFLVEMGVANNEYLANVPCKRRMLVFE